MTNAKNFFEKVSYDFVGKANLNRHVRMYKDKKAAVLKAGDGAGRFLLHVLKENGIEVVFQTHKVELSNLTDEEWLKCKSADVIICCSVHGDHAVERDNRIPVMIWDMLKD